MPVRDVLLLYRVRRRRLAAAGAVTPPTLEITA